MNKISRKLLPALVAGGVFAGLSLIAPGVVATGLAVAGGVLLAFGALALVATLTITRTAKRVLTQYPHLQRLGHRFDRRYEAARVTAVDEDANGRLTLQVAWQQQYTTELDEQGVPDGSSSDGPGVLTWLIPSQPPSTLQRDMLMDLPYREITLLEQGRIMPQGAVVLTRELVADNGTVVQATAPVLA